MAKIAFVTCQQLPEMSDDDRLVADALRRKDIAVTSAVWDAPEIDWSSFDSVVIRSTWDYHLTPYRYAKWVGSFSLTATRLWNAPDAVLANLHKSYLSSLAQRGIEVVPTAILSAGKGPSLREVLENNAWNDAVVKPAISASAYGTWRTSLASADADQHRFTEQLRCHDLLVQPFMPEVKSRGEWSLVFFGGRYSHAALKLPANGDFRVQRDFGGQWMPATPPAQLVAQAQSVLEANNHDLLYARVDGIEREGRFVLMELEINEPYLFVGLCEGAAERFAEEIVRRACRT
jgi:hypothetical protein